MIIKDKFLLRSSSKYFEIDLQYTDVKNLKSEIKFELKYFRALIMDTSVTLDMTSVYISRDDPTWIDLAECACIYASYKIALMFQLAS